MTESKTVNHVLTDVAPICGDYASKTMSDDTNAPPDVPKVAPEMPQRKWINITFGRCAAEIGPRYAPLFSVADPAPDPTIIGFRQKGPQ